MTHDELLAKIKTGHQFLGITYAPDSHTFALRAVVELHQPDEIYGDFCSACESVSKNSLYIDYPCPTIQAIERVIE